MLKIRVKINSVLKLSVEKYTYKKKNVSLSEALNVKLFFFSVHFQFHLLKGKSFLSYTGACNLLGTEYFTEPSSR